MSTPLTELFIWAPDLGPNSSPGGLKAVFYTNGTPTKETQVDVELKKNPKDKSLLALRKRGLDALTKCCKEHPHFPKIDAVVDGKTNYTVTCDICHCCYFTQDKTGKSIQPAPQPVK